VEADYVLDYNLLSMAREHHLYLMARIKAGANPNAQKRRPLNLSVVLDRSGSMSGDKLSYVKKATQFLVQHLGVQDRFSLVTYDQKVAVHIAPTSVVHKDNLSRSIETIMSGGTTNLSGGWLQGCQLVAEGLAEGQSNRVMLLTDGLANEGVTDSNRLVAMARQKREEGVTTTTMGVGMDFNEDLLTRMANEGGGAFYFIDNPDQAPKIFAEELNDLLSVVGQNLVIALTLSSKVSAVKYLNTYPMEKGAGNMTFRLGDLFADEIKTLLLELTIPALQTLGEVEVAWLRFDYDELAEERVTHRTLELPIKVNAVRDEDYHEGAPNAEVVRTALLLRAAQAREEAIKYADKGEFDKAKQTLSDIADSIQRSIQQGDLDDKALQIEQNMLREEALDMELGPLRYDSHMRKASSTISHYGSTRKMNSADSILLRERLKASRKAIERSGAAPTLVTWNQQSLTLNADLVRVGRAADNDIVIDEEPVSRYHCQIVRDGDSLYLEDLGSINGTFANGGKVQGRFRLSVGDIVTVGACLFNFLAG
jgi:Ca-activated chloride channel family protein